MNNLGVSRHAMPGSALHTNSAHHQIDVGSGKVRLRLLHRSRFCLLASRPKVACAVKEQGRSSLLVDSLKSQRPKTMGYFRSLGHFIISKQNDHGLSSFFPGVAQSSSSVWGDLPYSSNPRMIHQSILSLEIRNVVKRHCTSFLVPTLCETRIKLKPLISRAILPQDQPAQPAQPAKSVSGLHCWAIPASVFLPSPFFFFLLFQLSCTRNSESNNARFPPPCPLAPRMQLAPFNQLQPRLHGIPAALFVSTRDPISQSIRREVPLCDLGVWLLILGLEQDWPGLAACVSGPRE